MMAHFADTVSHSQWPYLCRYWKLWHPRQKLKHYWVCHNSIFCVQHKILSTAAL